MTIPGPRNSIGKPSAPDRTGNNNSYTHTHGNNGLSDRPQSSKDPRDPTEGDTFMQCNHNVSLHSSNNNNEYIYTDPSHLSMEDAMFIDEEDEQALHEAFVFIPTAKTVRFKNSDVAPIAMVRIKTINQIKVARPLVCLLDSGSTGTMIQTRALPPGVVPNISKQNRITTTANGSFDTSKSIALEHIQLPEFVNGRVVGGVEARLFNAPSY